MSNALSYNSQINEKIRSITDPFLEKMGLTQFMYINLIDRKHRMYISNNHDWCEKYVNLSLHEDKVHEKDVIKRTNKPRYALWDGYKKDRVFQVCKTFHFYHGFIIYDGSEIYSFATNQDRTQMVNSYFSNLDLFEHFVMYFKSKAYDLIQIEDKNKLLVSNSHKDDDSQDEYFEENDDKKILFDHMKIEHFYIRKSSNEEVKLTKRQAQTLMLLSKGMTVAEVAWFLKISGKTAEVYVDQLKLKFSCSSKAHVIQKFKNNNPFLNEAGCLNYV